MTRYKKLFNKLKKSKEKALMWFNYHNLSTKFINKYTLVYENWGLII